MNSESEKMKLPPLENALRKGCIDLSTTFLKCYITGLRGAMETLGLSKYSQPFNISRVDSLRDKLYSLAGID